MMATSKTSPKHKKVRWSKQDLEFLEQNYGHLTNAEIAKQLNRSQSSVTGAIRRYKIGKGKQKEYAVYFDDEYQFSGTSKECADRLGVKEISFMHYITPSYKNRVKNGMVVVELGLWEREESV